jgi:hypothetical protein
LCPSKRVRNPQSTLLSEANCCEAVDPDSEDDGEDIPLIINSWIGVGGSFGCSYLFALMAYCGFDRRRKKKHAAATAAAAAAGLPAPAKPTPTLEQARKFLIIELMDICTENGCLVLAWQAGDLDFTNDEFYLMKISLVASSVLSLFAFVQELGIYCMFQQQLIDKLWILKATHVSFEDLFQLCLYILVGMSQAAEGLDNFAKALIWIVGIVQC